MGFQEKFSKKKSGLSSPLRYIDDIFFIWTHGENELKTFMGELNQFLPNLKFTYETSKDKLAFFRSQCQS